jgi:hypothetical protein
LQELNKNFEDCSKDNEVLNEELKSTKEDYELVSYQSKIVSNFDLNKFLIKF